MVHAVSLNLDPDGSPALLVAQPGGAFMKLKCASSQPEAQAEHETEDTDQSGDEADTAVEGDVEADLSAMLDDAQKQLLWLSPMSDIVKQVFTRKL